MKKTLFIIGFIYTALCTFANPVATNNVIVNELLFTEEGFQLELFCNYPDDESSITQIEITTTNSSKVFTEIPFTTEKQIWVLTEQDFPSNFILKYEGDKITINTSISLQNENFTNENTFQFGGENNAYLNFPSKEYSISFYPGVIYYMDGTLDLYALDHSPTIGTENDTTGACATLTGKIQNLNQLPIKDFWFKVHYHAYANKEGIYTTRVLAAKYQSSSIMSGTHRFDCEKYSFEAIPGELVEADITVQTEDDFSSSTDSKSIDLQVHPNPASDFIKIKLSEQPNNVEIYITDINGKLLHQETISNIEHRVDLNKQFKAGMYLLQIKEQGQIIQSSKFLVNPF